MNTKSLAIFGALLFGSGVLLMSPQPATAQSFGPPGLPPQIFVFQSYDENLATLNVTQTVVRHVPVTEVRVNAAGVEETITVLVPEHVDQLNTHLLAETTLRTIGGKELDRKEAAKALKKGQPVILLVKGQKLADGFKNLFRDEVVILEVKALGIPPELAPKEPRTK